MFEQITTKLKTQLGVMYDPSITTLRVVGIIILAVLAARMGSFIIKKIFEKQKAFKHKFNLKKIDTMATLLTSVYRYAVYIIAVVTILVDQFKLTSILAAAGIGGVALGLGAQSLIKDVISGFFIILEDQFIVGDVITIETITGTVEEMELRVTKIRNANGDLHIVPNGEIKKVTNHVRGNKAVIVDIPLAYSADVEKAFQTASEVCSAASKEFSTLVEEPKVLGITEMGKDNINLRITAKTLPNEQWEVERRIRRMIIEEFDRKQIEFTDRARNLS